MQYTDFGSFCSILKQLLLTRIKKTSSEYVILFDKNLNDVTQTKQMDIHTRFWDGDTVRTRYPNSEFLGHAAADDLKVKLVNGRLAPGISGSNIHGWSTC